MTNSTYQRGIHTIPLLSPSYWSGWLWPVPVWNGRVPTVSDQFQREASADHRQHFGVDIMFPRLFTDPVKGGEAPVDGVHGTIHFVMPDGVPCISPYVGRVWSAGMSPRGYEMRIDHGLMGGIPVNSYVQHLTSFARDWKRGDVVYPGTSLGIVGGDIKPGAYHLQHLHFGLLFFRSRGEPFDSYWVNPQPYMQWWKKVALGVGPVGTPISSGSESLPSSDSGIATALGATALAVGGLSVLRRRRRFYL